MVKKFWLIWAVLILSAPWTWALPRLLKETPVKLEPVIAVSPFEVADINRIRGFHDDRAGQAAAKIAWNRPVLVLDKFLGNAFSLLDPNYYFFAKHPRERVGVKEINKFWSVEIVLLIGGLIILVRKKKLMTWVAIFSGTVAVLAFLGLTDNLSSYLLAPILVWPMAEFLCSIT